MPKFENNFSLLILCCISFPVVSCPETGCGSDGVRRYEIKTNDIGLALCAIDVQPLGILNETQHLGECMRACALKPNCTVYTYFSNTSRCQIGYYPLQYVSVPHCSSFALVKLEFFALLVLKFFENKKKICIVMNVNTCAIIIKINY